MSLGLACDVRSTVPYLQSPGDILKDLPLTENVEAPFTVFIILFCAIWHWIKVNTGIACWAELEECAWSHIGETATWNCVFGGGMVSVHE